MVILSVQAPPHNFQIGDVIYLNSGSPPLVVVDFDEVGRLVAAWRDDLGHPHECYLPHYMFYKAHSRGKR